MPTKKTVYSPKIVLSGTATVKLDAILAKPQTSQQKKSVKRAQGTYDRYKSQWVKTQ